VNVTWSLSLTTTMNGGGCVVSLSFRPVVQQVVVMEYRWVSGMDGCQNGLLGEGRQELV
jgi:hypothetical protein